MTVTKIIQVINSEYFGKHWFKKDMLNTKNILNWNLRLKFSLRFLKYDYSQSFKEKKLNNLKLKIKVHKASGFQNLSFNLSVKKVILK